MSNMISIAMTTAIAITTPPTIPPEDRKNNCYSINTKLELCHHTQLFHNIKEQF